MNNKVVVVTGANKGIGLQIVKSILLQAPQSQPLTVYLCSRDSSRGKKALEDVLQGKSVGDHVVKVGDLDISNQESIRKFVDRVESESGKTDILINNAGVAISGNKFDREVVDYAFNTNYHGTKNVIQSFIPLLKKSTEARIVNVGSTAGRSGIITDPSVLARFTKDDLTEEELEKAVADFKNDVSAGDYAKKGWPATGYGMSKLALQAYTRIAARENPGMLINNCCPGYVKTDMAPGGVKTLEQGAKTPVMLALDDINNVTGEFWRDGRVQVW
ncbi:Dehydrogenases with different specificities (related to short-chain alcohol dehydrogenases) [Phaffia rhodozyma]|uniref:Dehydrogenases with different specificities (Related to short-chain alcohol dehydrogenases) n=1 Tax=Phaffia rhodozyma TaxID=264483 RepID=A0A0F7SMX3_PHARH|nr:Dehydrogenases with different specificities (related to short-chain alcohol dehydrogenases) [Phaffia rhodozyma]